MRIDHEFPKVSLKFLKFKEFFDWNVKQLSL